MISINSVSKVFEGPGGVQITALREISLTIRAGEFVTIIGGNGSGKSTLLNIVAGSVKPSTGKVFLADEDVTSKSEWKRPKIVARVFQNAVAGLAPSLSVVENLTLSAKRSSLVPWRRCVRTSDRQSAQRLLEEVGQGIHARLDAPVSTLSGGQLQGLAVLLASVSRPSILLLDEHLSALDPRARQNVLKVTNEVISRDRLTTLMVTHSIEDAIANGNRLLMLHRGSLVLDVGGSEKACLTPEKLLEQFHRRTADEQETPKVFLNP